MSSTSITPIQRKNTLASNPSGDPTYGVSVKMASGAEAMVADPAATRGLVALMDMQAVMGGAASHFGGPSAFAEIMSAIYGVAFTQAKASNSQWYEKFHIINDAGHCENGIYALKANYGFADLTVSSLKGFRSIQSPLTGHGESHIWPEGVYLSNGPLGSSLPQAQGLACADGISGTERVTVTAISDGACMEGEAKEAFAAIPGLAQKGKMAPFVMVISDNNTKLSGRIDEQSFSMTPSFSGLETLGWKVLTLEDGHNLQQVVTTFEAAVAAATADPTVPVVIHAKTIKGKGTKKTEESASGAHGFPLKSPTELSAFVSEIYGGGTVPTEFSAWIDEMIQQEKDRPGKGEAPEIPVEKVQVGVAKALIQKRKEGLPVISVSSDLPGSTGLAGFQKAYPECTIDVGIAESNMVSMASGLAKEGFIPIVDTFAQFGVTKGALPLTMAALSGGPVIAIFSHIGFQDAADGASHQALSYLSMVSSIPDTDVYLLSTSAEAEALVSQAVDHFAEAFRANKSPRSQVFFLGRETFPQRVMPETYQYELGKAQVVLDNSDEFDESVVLAAGGALLHQAISAAKELEAKGCGAIVIQPTSANHPDIDTIASALKKCGGRLVTVDDHQKIGGMGALLVHALVDAGVSLKASSLGVNGEFGQSAYKASELYEKHGMDSVAIAKAGLSLL